MRTPGLSLSLVLPVLLCCACGTAPPPPAQEPTAGDSAAEHRELRAALDRLEQRIAELAERLSRQEASGSKGGEGAAVTSGAADARELDERLDRVARLEKKLEDQIARNGGAPGAAPPSASPPARGRPDPNVVYAVPVDGFPSRGPKDAPVTLVRSFEFACPYSHKSLPTMEDLLKAYPKDLRIVYRSYIVHPNIATDPARAACAAHRQGKFVAMHDAIWTRGFEANRNLSMENMERIATDLGLDMTQFRADVNGSCVDAVRADMADMGKVGQGGTPAFWINGRFLSGARPVEHFTAIIDAELAEANKHIGKRGVTRGNYYKKVILKKGKKAL